MSKQNYYRLEKLNDTIPANYHILLGERSNGKSYAVKERALLHAWHYDNNRFMLIRRWGLEIKATYIEQYFKDAPITAITNGECDTVVCTAGKIYLAKSDQDTRKVIKIKHVGYYRDLCGEQHFVSQNFDDVTMVIFEEFISRDYYLPDEVRKLEQFISTIARRRLLPVYMIGNTISRVCPYWSEWQLTNVPKQKQGTIDLYEKITDQYDDNGDQIIVRITVEYCENSGANSKMFFGASAKMITGGQWQVKDYPHLNGKLTDYCVMHRIIFLHTGFKFQMFFVMSKNGGAPFWYVRPYSDNVYTDKLRNERFVVRSYAESINLTSDMFTIGFVPLTPEEKQTFDYLDRVVFSDNLTGSDYENCVKTLTR